MSGTELITENRVTRPLLNYFGGKWRLAPWIVSNFPSHKIYVEPFGGSLSVLLRKDRSKREIVNDIDSELFNLYKVARDNGNELLAKLSLTPHSRTEYKASINKHKDPIEAARRTIVRCYFGIGDSFLHGHNAFRTSKTSNVSVAHSWASYIDAFNGIIERLSRVTIECLPYEDMFKKYDSGETLWYLDPPYLLSTRSSSHAYREDWTEFKHLQFLGEIKKLKGRVVLSGYPSTMYESDLGDWQRVEKESATNGTKRIEVLWIK